MSLWGRKEAESEDAGPNLDTGTRSFHSGSGSRGPVFSETRHAVMGPTIEVKGELCGAEDLAIEGKFEGVIRLGDHNLVVGKNAHVLASIKARSVRIEGTVQGDVLATEKVELASGSTLDGDIRAGRVVIADGARFRGSVDMDTPPPSGVDDSSEAPGGR